MKCNLELLTTYLSPHIEYKMELHGLIIHINPPSDHSCHRRLGLSGLHIGEAEKYFFLINYHCDVTRTKITYTQ